MRGLLDLVYPPTCAGCDLPGTLLCDSCRSAIARIDPLSACPKCGAPDGRERCAECQGTRFAFREARCAALLAQPVSRAIVLLKDGGERRYADVLGALLAEAADRWLEVGDVLVPVPATPAAVRKRGFNHAADLARILHTLSGTPVAPLLRSAPGADQRALTRSERFANRAGAFQVAIGLEIPPRVVLVDDVLTTGATLDAAALALRCAGVRDVRVLAVARAVRG